MNNQLQDQSQQVSLETLSSIFPTHSIQELNRFLKASNFSLERATLAILNGNESLVTAETGKKKRKASVGGLDNWLGLKKPSTISTTTTSREEDNSTTVKSAFSVLRPPPTLATSSTLPPLPPLILGTDALIDLHTKGLCTLIPNVLSKELASRLYLRMIKESLGETDLNKDEAGGENVNENLKYDEEKGKGKGESKGKKWERNKWILFDREVTSPHTTEFYTEGELQAKESGTSAYDQNAFAEAAQYWYNGEKRSASIFNSEMNEAREIIGPVVKAHLAKRKRKNLEWEDWIPNVAAANCYRGSKEVSF